MSVWTVVFFLLMTPVFVYSTLCLIFFIFKQLSHKQKCSFSEFQHSDFQYYSRIMYHKVCHLTEYVNVSGKIHLQTCWEQDHSSVASCSLLCWPQRELQRTRERETIKRNRKCLAFHQKLNLFLMCRIALEWVVSFRDLQATHKQHLSSSCFPVFFNFGWKFPDIFGIN